MLWIYPDPQPLTLGQVLEVVKPSTISTAQLNALLRLHLKPINLIISQGS